MAVATQGHEKRVVEIIAVNDSFPWSVASNGSITGNDMEVYSIISTHGLAGGASANGQIRDDQKHKSNILSNSSSGGTLGSSASIYLTGNSVVTGKAQAVGDVVALPPSTVEQELPKQDPQTITLAATADNFKPDPADTTVYGPTVTEISGLYEATATGGPVIVGDIHFNDGLLYIRGPKGSPAKGDVELRGNITGNGAVVAEGNITVTGSMQTTSDLAALVADGDITITGPSGGGPGASSFNGLILAKGSFKAKDTRLIGSIITLDDTGSVQLERVQSVSAKNLTQIDLNVSIELKKAANSNLTGGFQSTDFIGVLYTDKNDQQQFVILDPKNYSALEALALQANNSGGTATTKVILRQTTGDIDIDPNNIGAIPSTLRSSAGSAYSGWNNYLNEVKTDTVKYEKVFQLDFNKFLKSPGTFRQAYWNSRPYKD